MKFFTPEACSTFDELESFRKVDAAYRQSLKELEGVLPNHVLELAKPSGMDDGLVAQVRHDRQKRYLRIVMRCGDLQMGYYNLVLTYEDAELLPANDRALAVIARSTLTQRRHGCDLAYHEVGMSPEGRIEHRLIFHVASFHLPEEGRWIWFTVSCGELRWRREPKRTRRLPPSQDRYPGGPDRLDWEPGVTLRNAAKR